MHPEAMFQNPGSIAGRYAVLTGANLLAAVAGFLAVLSIVEHFGPAGLGDTSLALAVVGYALTIAACGTQLHAVRRVAAAPETVGTVVGTVMLVRLGVGLATYLGLIALLTVVPGLAEIRLLSALFALSIFTNAFNVSWVGQALHRTSVLAAANFATQLLYLLGLWSFLAWRPALTTVAGCKVAADLTVTLALVLWLRQRVGPIERPGSPRELWRTLSQAAPLGGTKLLRTLALGSDLLLVGLLVSRRELGHYAGAMKLFMLLMSLAAAYFVILLPRLAQRAEGGGALAHEVTASLGRVLPVAIPAVVGLALFARPLLAGLFEPSFTTAALALRLLGLAFLANLIGRHFRQVLLVRGRQTTDLRLTSFAAAVHVTLKIALIPWLGLTGAALGTLLGETTLMLVLWRAARPELAGTPLREVANRPRP